MVLFGICLRQVVIHAVAVEVSPSLTDVIISELYPVLAGIHITEIPESQLVEIFIFLVFRRVRMPVSDIRSERIEQDIGLSDQGLYPGSPFIGICLYIIKGTLSEIDMSPAVGGELPAVVAETLRHLADRLLIGLSWGS